MRSRPALNCDKVRNTGASVPAAEFAIEYCPANDDPRRQAREIARAPLLSAAALDAKTLEFSVIATNVQELKNLNTEHDTPHSLLA